jgi:FHA domain
MSRPDAIISLQLMSSSKSQPQQTWALKPQPLVRIGRSPDCEIVVQHPNVSRLHAELFWREDRWELINRGQYGTFLNGYRVESMAIEPGAQLFRLGECGPFLLFVLDPSDSDTSDVATMMVSMGPPPSIDAAARDRQVEDIASSDFFRSLKEKAGGLRHRRVAAGSTTAPTNPGASTCP